MISYREKIDLDIKTIPIGVKGKSVFSVTRNLIFEILIE